MKHRVLVAMLAAASLGVPLLYAATPSNTASPAASDASKQMLELFGRAFGIVQSEYVEPVSDQKLVEAALNGMLTSLDPHSSYLTEDAYNEMKVQTRGKYGGLGLEITEENSLIKIVSPIDDTPAAEAGLQPGDLIMKVDGQATSDFSLTEIVTRLRGDIGSKVTLTVRRAGRDPFDVTLQRAEIKIKSVKAHLETGGIAYIRISSFIENTDDELRQALQAIQRQAAADKAGGDKSPDKTSNDKTSSDKPGSGKLTGLVLDLRNDPGGLVDQAVAVAGDFLDKGEIVSIRGRHPDDVKRYNAKSGDISHGVPIVVLINAGSASASEIVAGALHDDQRAVLLGTKSFGKGSVQTIIPLNGRGALRLTTARYYTPSGRSIQAEGIEPDIAVEPARIEHFKEAMIQHEADLRGALKNTDKIAATPGAPAGPAPATADKAAALGSPQIGTADDYQLARALDLLRGVALLKARDAN
ncbi:MAG: S41 family peptidase [Alphaproteobacteria bacterium]|nr:S41 family peptidase [Alphaproteobacteria bacterium]